MRFKHLWILAFVVTLFAAVPAAAQPSAPSFRYVNVAPVGTCNVGTQNRYDWITNVEYGCSGAGPTGTWTAVSGGGGGTCATLGGDTTGTCAANTNVKINGEAIPVSAGALGTDANGGLIAVTPGGGTTPGYPANQPVSGCGVEYVSGLTFTVGACVYTIGGTQYTISSLTTVTLAAADPSNPRIDVIYVDNTGVASKITGTPASSPAQPTVDYSTQLPLNLVLVNANATTPSGITTTLIYDENVEWTSTCSTHLNCASTNNPYSGTKDIEATAAVLGNSVTLVKPAAGTVNLSTQNTLIFYIRSKAKWPSGNGAGSSGLRTLSLFWQNGATPVGIQVVLKDGAFGFTSSNTTTYQQISIPISQFGTGSSLVTTLVAQVSGNGGTSSFGWYIDEVTLQAGTSPITTPVTANQNTRTIGASFGSFQSGATALSASQTQCVTTYFSGTIQAVQIVADVSGSATIDVKTVAHTSWTGTASASSIAASDIPAISSASKYTDTTLTGWTTTFAAGTDVCFVMTSPTTVAGLGISLKVAAN